MFALQSPGEKLDWHQDWTDWMEFEDVIQTSTWAVTPIGPVLSGPLIDGSNMIATIKVEGLDLGLSYQLANTITTVGGRIGVREITLRCQHQ